MRLFTLLAVITIVVGGCSSETSSTSNDAETPDLAFVTFDVPPEPIVKPSPRYPDDARRAQAAGTAHVEVLVDVSGNVTETRIVQSSNHPVLDMAAEDAARQWVFTPAEKDNSPVAAKIVVPFEFKLK